MKPSDELFNLIKSLSKSEKRFFKLNSSLQRGDKNYVRIFDIIEKQENYDEAAIKSDFKGERFIKHFPSEKNHLFKTILKSLRAYYSDGSVDAVLIRELQNIDILFQKALFKECAKSIKRAKRLANQNEKFFFGLELIKKEKKVIEENKASRSDQTFNKLLEEEIQINERIHNLSAYHLLYSEISHVLRTDRLVRGKELRSKLLAISHNDLLKSKNKAQSERALFYFYLISAFTFDLLNQPEEAIRHYKSALVTLSGWKEWQTEVLGDYLKIHERLLVSYLILDRDKEAESVVDEITRFIENQLIPTANAEIKLERTQVLNFMHLYYHQNKHEEAIEKAQELQQFLDESGLKWGKTHLVLAKFRLATIYFKTGLYGKALFWNNQLLNDNENNVRQDVYQLARILNLLIHLELKNYDLLDYLLKSTSRFLEKRKSLFTLESLMISFVKRFKKLNAGLERYDLLIGAKDAVLNEVEKPENKKLRFLFDFEDYFQQRIDHESQSESNQGVLIKKD